MGTSFDILVKNHQTVHQTVIDEVKKAHWEKLNAKRSELFLLQEQVDRLKADNGRFQKTITKINS